MLRQPLSPKGAGVIACPDYIQHRTINSPDREHSDATSSAWMVGGAAAALQYIEASVPKHILIECPGCQGGELLWKGYCAVHRLVVPFWSLTHLRIMVTAGSLFAVWRDKCQHIPAYASSYVWGPIDLERRGMKAPT